MVAATWAFFIGGICFMAGIYIGSHNALDEEAKAGARQDPETIDLVLRLRRCIRSNSDSLGCEADELAADTATWLEANGLKRRPRS